MVKNMKVVLTGILLLMNIANADMIRYFSMDDRYGCEDLTCYKEDVVYVSFNDMINELANELLQYSELKIYTSELIAVTSFVNLDNFSQTSGFGRVVAESIMSELYMRGFNVVEYRGIKNLISINQNGEFHISRDIKNLKKDIKSKYIALGTYSKINENTLIINARIVDSNTGKVVSSGRVSFRLEDKKGIKLKSTRMFF